MKNMLRMTARQKLMHGFVEYVHYHGLEELRLEEWVAKEERRKKARARRLIKEIV